MKKSDVIEALGALAQETRLDIFRMLVQAGEDGLPAGRIGEQLDLPSPTLSFHLAQLRHAGLIVPRRDGRSIIYAAGYDRMRELLAFLMEDCCGGKPEICAPLVALASQGCSAESSCAREEMP